MTMQAAPCRATLPTFADLFTPKLVSVFREGYGLAKLRGDALVLGATVALVVLRDLTEGIVVGFALGAVLFIARMANSVDVGPGPGVAEDVADRDGVRPPHVRYKANLAGAIGRASDEAAVPA